MLARGAPVFALLGLAACRTAAVHEEPPHPPAKTDAAAPFDAGAPSAAAVADAAAPPPGPPSELYAIAEGACPAGTVYGVGSTPVVVTQREAWSLEAAAARPFYRLGGAAWNEFEGRMLGGENAIGRIGGSDEQHAWAQAHTITTREQDDSHVDLVRPTFKTLATPRGEYGFYALTHVVPQPDGGLWAFGEHSMYLDIPGDRNLPNDVSHDRWFAWSADGTPLDVHLPGPDMNGAERLGSGELVASGLGKSGKAVLRRWSPTRKVADLASTVATTKPPLLLLGTARAVLAIPERRVFLSYRGDDALRPTALAPRDATSWLVTTDDTLWVTSSDGTLHSEALDGSVATEPLPEKARLAAEPSRPWLMGDSGALWVRVERQWKKVAYPANGPWSTDPHPAGRLEWVRTVAGETFASVVRTDQGFGARTPGQVRVLYASKTHGPPLRCGAPWPKGALAPLGPRAEASCTERVVVLGPAAEKDPAKAYAKVATALKGDAALGEELGAVVFGSKPLRAFGLVAPTAELAAALTKKLARLAPQAPEVVCGTSGEVERLRYLPKTGAFVSAP